MRNPVGPQLTAKCSKQPCPDAVVLLYPKGVFSSQCYALYSISGPASFIQEATVQEEGDEAYRLRKWTSE